MIVMLKVRARVVLCALIVLGAVMVHAEGQVFESLETISDTPSYVVEVFTSQGCSSCPPADDLVSRLFQEAQSADINLYVLSWHVDYWDYLGWPDPYGSAGSTRRQRNYARRSSRPNTVYTPQLLVNGHVIVQNPYQTESIVEALRVAGRHSSSLLDFELDFDTTDSNDEITVHYTQRQPSAANSLLGNTYEVGLLIVESGLVTRPTRGENGGRTLHNNHVVRANRFERLRRSGSLTASLPAGIDRTQSSAIVIAQDRQTHKIVFAQSAQL